MERGEEKAFAKVSSHWMIFLTPWGSSKYDVDIIFSIFPHLLRGEFAFASIFCPESRQHPVLSLHLGQQCRLDLWKVPFARGANAFLIGTFAAERKPQTKGLKALIWCRPAQSTKASLLVILLTFALHRHLSPWTTNEQTLWLVVICSGEHDHNKASFHHGFLLALFHALSVHMQPWHSSIVPPWWKPSGMHHHSHTPCNEEDE